MPFASGRGSVTSRATADARSATPSMNLILAHLDSARARYTVTPVALLVFAAAVVLLARAERPASSAATPAVAARV